VKVAILTDGIHPYVIGGMQKHSTYLVKFLAQRGVAVELYHCVAFGKRKPNESEVKRMMELDANAPLVSHCLEFPRADWMPGHYLKESFSYSRQIFGMIKNKLDTFDFIYVKGFAGWHLIEQKKKGLSMPPVGIKFHGYEMYQKAPNFRAKLEQSLLRGPAKFCNIHADYVFSYGGKITPIIEAMGVSKEQIIEIPTGIASNWIVDEPKKIEGPRSFLFVGRYERRKGIEELNQALEALASEDFIFHFIGPILKDKQLKIKQAKYHGKIMDEQKIQEIMAKCEVLVTPSHSEGMPNVIMEGMARGLAVIATNVGAVAAQVDDKNGWLLSNTDSLKDTLRAVIQMDRKELLPRRKESIDKVQNLFTWEKVAETTEIQIEQRR
jgi:glycosyltransferase involved in cell wall biosynthesis